MPIPTIETARLILRAPCADDFPVYRAFYDDAEASALYGGPLPAELAWRKLAVDIGHWALRGFGMWSLVERSNGRTIGSCGIVWPEGWPRHELTWWVVPGARRRGYAEEASRAAIDWARTALGWPWVETHMNDENVAARRLAEKLGGSVMTRETFPDGLTRSVYVLAVERPSARASS
jgi:ribosomal-protein-alanine N-acetyltransferase